MKKTRIMERTGKIIHYLRDIEFEIGEIRDELKILLDLRRKKG